ncbi:MAG: hypothetical protein IE927_16270 [Rhodobacterales bacterium]|nr:hypothetical protein [Rhodobacterales bacterium]
MATIGKTPDQPQQGQTVPQPGQQPGQQQGQQQGQSTPQPRPGQPVFRDWAAI